MKLNKKQALVYRVIQDNLNIQNDEAALIAAVWRVEGWSDSQSLEHNIARVTRPETVSRRRRELFNMGLIHYSDKADQERTEAFNNERDRHSSFYDKFV